VEHECVFHEGFRVQCFGFRGSIFEFKGEGLGFLRDRLESRF
jgi:hypothetical protein